MLDSDGEGVRQKARYKELFGAAVEGRIFVLADVNGEWLGKSLELLFSDSDRQSILMSVYPTATRFSKTRFNRAFQELFLTRPSLELEQTTVANFSHLLDWCSSRLASLGTSPGT
jgi:hypothetical protein